MWGLSQLYVCDYHVCLCKIALSQFYQLICVGKAEE